MPQKKSYFALQLPKSWWVFGLDLSLHDDIDVYQFKFFSELVKNKVIFTPRICSLFCLLLMLHFELSMMRKYTNWRGGRDIFVM